MGGRGASASNARPVPLEARRLQWRSAVETPGAARPRGTEAARLATRQRGAESATAQASAPTRSETERRRPHPRRGRGGRERAPRVGLGGTAHRDAARARADFRHHHVTQGGTSSISAALVFWHLQQHELRECVKLRPACGPHG